MPPKKRHTLTVLPDSRRKKNARAAETDEQHSQRQTADAAAHASKRQTEPLEQRLTRQKTDAHRHYKQRQSQAQEGRQTRLQGNAARNASQRETETPQSRQTRLQANAARNASQRETETPQCRQTRLQANAARNASQRETETPQCRQTRLQANAARNASRRETETPQCIQTRLQANAARNASQRETETPEQRQSRLHTDANRHASSRIQPYTAEQWYQSAFNYNSHHDYASDRIVTIGSMSKLCGHCGAKKWDKETPGMCCSNGKIQLPMLPDPPEPLNSLLIGTNPESRHFLQNIQKYNSAFQMTSFGTHIVTERGFMPTFKVQGQVYHRIGSLQPLPNEQPRYLQLYFVGDLHEQAQSRHSEHQETRFDLILKLQEMLHSTNSYVQSFKFALETEPTPEFQVIIDADKRPSREHARRFNAPECNEVAVVISDEQYGKRDIVLKCRDDNLKRISETHRSYDALQYPLLFVNGEDGYHFGISHAGADSRKTVSCMDFYAFRIMLRNNSFNHLHRGQTLFHQFAVDMYAKVESERLCYIRTHQKELRAESYIHLRDGINNDVTGGQLGQLCILPSSFTGSPRYMHERTQDAMKYVRHYGRPDLFITFTCNARWREIEDELLPGQTYIHRHDLTARVFRLKVVKLMDLVTKSQIAGPVRCQMYTIEWQKRGLPHAHVLIWLFTKIHSSQIDSIISAELPDPTDDQELFEIVKKQMVHGPCGSLNYNSPCMKDNKCTKRYPKPFLRETQTGEDGYPSYRRRKPEDGGFKAKVGQHEIDNRWIVPYCPLLSKTFNAHINVEFCNSVKSIKYVCKYINKGTDAAMFALQQQNVRDEVTQYQMGRYLSSNEAFWRIFGFPIHERHPAIQQLSVHLENGQRVYFTAETAVQQASTPKDTTLTAFFKVCQHDSFAKKLLYHEVPSYYTWQNNRWSRRKRGAVVEGHPDIRIGTTLGRVYTVHPSQHECFFLRLLLHQIRGPTSFEDVRTVEGHVCATYREACFKRELLEDDSQWDATLSEASTSHTAGSLRLLFAILLKTCEVGNPVVLWMKYRDDFSEDFKHQAELSNSEIEITYNDEIYNAALIAIEDKFISMGGDSLQTLGLPQTNRTQLQNLTTEVLRETSYDIDVLSRYTAENEPKLMPDQKSAYLMIIDSIHNQTGRLFFLDAPGGTGKTFVIKLLLAKIRQQKKIALAVASSGISATLLPGGRTAHSAFKLPLDLATNDAPVCNISKTSGAAQVLKTCQLIVWDECTMAHKRALEALDRTLRDIRNNNSLMGGVTVVLSGDFRQTLPIIPKGTRADEIKACLKSSPLWLHANTINLSTNMRAHLYGDNLSGQFAEKLLQLGEGKICLDSDDAFDPTFMSTVVRSVDQLVTRVFPNLQQNYQNHIWLCERAILAPKNVTVCVINDKLLDEIPGDTIIYKSVDTITDPSEVVDYPTEFLNSLQPPGLPSHRLLLKVGAPIMLLRNLDQPRLCNGTRLVVTKLMPHVIEATILTGCGKGEDVFIPRIPLIPSDVPFQFRRLQFPVRLSFAMSINKSQGQTLTVVGLQLDESCFSHGQLYVGCSRVGSQHNLFVNVPAGKTRNIVYTEVL